MNKLKVWRLERGLTQHALAEISGVPRHIIQLLESGVDCHPSESKTTLSKVLGVLESDLFPQKPSDAPGDLNAAGRRGDHK